MDSSYCGDSLMGVSIAIMPIQMALVAGRFYTRHVQEIPCTADDYLMIPAVVGAPSCWMDCFLTASFSKIGSLGQSVLFIVCTGPYRDLILAPLTVQVLKVAGLGYHYNYIQKTAPEKLVSLQKVTFPYYYAAANRQTSC